MGDRVNSYFASERTAGEIGENDNGVPYVSALISENPNGDRSLERGQRVSLFDVGGFDVDTNRSTNQAAIWNTYLGRPVGSAFPGNSRRIVIVDMTLAADGQPRFEILYNEDSDGNLADGEGDDIIAAINAAQPPVIVVDPVATWAEENNVPVAQRGDTDDPDGDGIANLLEYALDSDPNKLEATRAPTIVSNLGALRLEFEGRQNLEGFTLSLLSTTDLGQPFTPLVTRLSPSSTTATAGRLPYSIPLINGDDVRFFRLAVSRDEAIE